MRKLFIILALSLLPFAASAQSYSFKTFSGKYSGKSGYTVVEMTGNMLRTLSGSGNAMLDKAARINNIDNIVIVVCEKRNSLFTKDINILRDSNDYTKISSVATGGQAVEFYISKVHGEVVELLMIALTDDEQVVMSLVGKDLNVSKLLN